MKALMIYVVALLREVPKWANGAASDPGVQATAIEIIKASEQAGNELLPLSSSTLITAACPLNAAALQTTESDTIRHNRTRARTSTHAKKSAHKFAHTRSPAPRSFPQ